MATVQGQDTGKATPAVDEFADAFAQLTQDEAAPAAGAEGTTAAAPEAPAEEKPASEADAGLPDPAQIGADGKPVVETPAEPEAGAEGASEGGTEPEPKVEPKGDANADFLRQLTETLASAGKAKVETPQEAQPPSPITPFTAEENTLVEAYKKEWPDVYMAEQLVRRQEYQALTAHIFQQLAPVLQQIQQTTGTMANATHLQQLQAAVPDYAEVAPKVMDWVGKQPAYLKSAYEAVAKQGSVQDVVDLIGRFRADTGTAAPAAKAAAAAVPPKPAVPPKLAPAAKDVKGLAPVRSTRSGVSTDAVAADDYDGAWKAAATADA